ncbi:hypothetical protein [Limnobacter alexandrii]|uniref:hypothetical protein n=1 Tax=Limnobacter alexandrii TaxID=2570352 RepID=UPI001108C17C|nr:hypothetical protein [Limnobacter alexandrii]
MLGIKNMSIQTFDYCSLYYLNQWLTYDRGYCQALSKGNEEKKLSALKSAGGFYRVARNLPSEFDEKKGLKRYQPVLEILDGVSKEHFRDDQVKKILEIEREISGKYGNRSVLSLTTKFLWLKIKQPVLIYDSQARIAVGSENGDLAGYYKKWNESFEIHKEQIQKSCSKLPELNLYAVDQEVGTKEYIKEVSSKSWFQERVFDIYLWSKGKNV